VVITLSIYPVYRIFSDLFTQLYERRDLNVLLKIRYKVLEISSSWKKVVRISHDAEDRAII
jgi:hypothetical protein